MVTEILWLPVLWFAAFSVADCGGGLSEPPENTGGGDGSGYDLGSAASGGAGRRLMLCASSTGGAGRMAQRVRVTLDGDMMVKI